MTPQTGTWGNRLALRRVTAADLPAFFEFQLDPEANHLAGFTARDPTDRGAFMAHWQRIMADPSNIMRAIACDGRVVGHVSSYERDGKPEVTYWIAREHWGRGIATWALTEFLLHANRTRPMYARVAKDNFGSRRVLAKCGFTIIAESTGFARARGEEIEELLLQLDGHPGAAPT